MYFFIDVESGSGPPSDNDGGSATTEQTINVLAANVAPVAAFTSAVTGATARFD